jgi:4-aminobutyrate aminotransferase-like enzyme
MAEYIDRTLLEPDTEWSEYDDDFISYSKSQINSLPTADVIERAEYDKIVQAFKALVEMKNENLIDMRDKYYALEKEYAELKINIKKAIEEIEQEIIETDYHANNLLGSKSHGMRVAIEILKRNTGEL